MSKLLSLSCLVNLATDSLYLLSLNISSALCMLNEQHIPLSVGNMVKMLEQLILRPFQAHHFRIPNMKYNLRRNIQ